MRELARYNTSHCIYTSEEKVMQLILVSLRKFDLVMTQIHCLSLLFSLVLLLLLLLLLIIIIIIIIITLQQNNSKEKE